MTLPTLYEYYTNDGIKTGLSANQPHFTLNNKNITIYSGAMHYFRVPKPYWRDRLRKIRAAGLNTVETYVPWNLHEPQPGNFDFGDGDSDMSDFLDIKHFFELAKEEDLFAIVRPGPYICSEWEFGGLPSWLLRDKDMIVRTSQPNFMKHVEKYFNVLLPILALLQFTKGGSIIALQIENEYASTSHSGHFQPDKVYLEELRKLHLNNGIVELLFTSDAASLAKAAALPQYFLLTANLANDPEEQYKILKELQGDKPYMVMEFWAGWFDRWTEDHNDVPANKVKEVLEKILKYPASVNIYMFHGGTNWGFMNGANIKDDSTDNAEFQPSTTSYDYDAPLSEDGDYRKKYYMIRDLIKKYNKINTKLPSAPELKPRIAFPSITESQRLKLTEAVSQIPLSFKSKNVISMEQLPIGESGQSYGYIIYRKTNVNISARSVLKIEGRVCDTVMVLINGELASQLLTNISDFAGFGYWKQKNSTLVLTLKDLTNATLELVVENWGRCNFGYIEQFKQYKGLWQGGVFINNEELNDWDIVPVEFKRTWNIALKGWKSRTHEEISTPALYKFVLEIDHPQDTFIDMRNWTKGIVIVNGFVLGRYLFLGPQQSLYYPAPLQKTGKNEIIVFEHFEPSKKLDFSKNRVTGLYGHKSSPALLSNTLML